MSVGWLAPDPPDRVLCGFCSRSPHSDRAGGEAEPFAASVPLTLYGITFATILLPLRGVIEGSAIFGRLLLLAQAICFAVPIAIDLHKGRLQQALAADRNAGVVRAGALFVISCGSGDGLPRPLRVHGTRAIGCDRAWAAFGIRPGLWHDGPSRSMAPRGRCLPRRSSAVCTAPAARIRRMLRDAAPVAHPC